MSKTVEQLEEELQTAKEEGRRRLIDEHEMRTVAEIERDLLRARLAELPRTQPGEQWGPSMKDRCPICGGENKYDATHTRCL